MTILLTFSFPPPPGGHGSWYRALGDLGVPVVGHQGVPARNAALLDVPIVALWKLLHEERNDPAVSRSIDGQQAVAELGEDVQEVDVRRRLVEVHIGFLSTGRWLMPGHGKDNTFPKDKIPQHTCIPISKRNLVFLG